MTAPQQSHAPRNGLIPADSSCHDIIATPISLAKNIWNDFRHPIQNNDVFIFTFVIAILLTIIYLFIVSLKYPELILKKPICKILDENNVLIKILHSFVYAFKGIVYLLKNETNGRVHFFATAVVIAAGIYYRLNAMEWIAISLCIGMVLAVEL